MKLVNARHVKNVPGRKSDVLDCQWLQILHTYGLLEGAFQPAAQLCTLSAYVRQRTTLVRYAASRIPHMRKALARMNLQLANVVSGITGATGMRIIRAILRWRTGTQGFAGLRVPHCHGTWTLVLKADVLPEELFVRVAVSHSPPVNAAPLISTTTEAPSATAEPTKVLPSPYSVPAPS